jgi:large subunit ribosomal protein L21
VQHLVEENRWYTCNRLRAEPGDVVNFGRVLAYKADGELHVGQPYVDGVKVEAEIVEEFKGPKVLVYKMRPKKHYRRTKGHRQCLTKCALAFLGLFIILTAGQYVALAVCTCVHTTHSLIYQARACTDSVLVRTSSLMD